jgi:hypothetical protein
MKTSTQADADKLKFYDNDASLGFYGSGEIEWTKHGIVIGSGIRTFKWVYEKDSSGSSGADCVWIDKITLVDLP